MSETIGVDELNEQTEDLGFFVHDLRRLAKHYIQRFFADKLSFSGAALTDEELFQPRFLDNILNLDICSGIGLIYQAVEVVYTIEEMRGFERKGQLPDDVKYVISLYNQCARMGIPKCFSTGMILMYLELCKGHCLEGLSVSVG